MTFISDKGFERIAQSMQKDLEVFLGTDQPEQCRYCGARTDFEDLPLEEGQEFPDQKHECPRCEKEYILEFDEDDWDEED